mmetsp:Transcript_26466/g.61711  ORF Transcript_26466/g.61711 Transcript_26466/m.61711 type:complete len:528 (+) Transcript_26466:56-1639(+)
MRWLWSFSGICTVLWVESGNGLVQSASAGPVSSSYCDISEHGRSASIGNCPTVAAAGLVEELHHWSHVEELSLELRYNGLGDAGAARLALQLSNFSNLTVLEIDLYGNLLTAAGVQQLGDGLLPLQQRLQRLSLSIAGNHVNDFGLEQLVSATCRLQKVARLFLNLSDNNITRIPAWRSAYAEGCLPALQTLHILAPENSISEVPPLIALGSCELPQLLEYTLDVSSNSVVAVAGVDSAPACTKSSSLSCVSLNLESNALEHDDIMQLVAVLSGLQNMQTLTLRLDDQKGSTSAPQLRSDAMGPEVLKQVLSAHLVHLSSLTVYDRQFLFNPVSTATSVPESSTVTSTITPTTVSSSPLASLQDNASSVLMTTTTSSLRLSSENESGTVYNQSNVSSGDRMEDALSDSQTPTVADGWSISSMGLTASVACMLTALGVWWYRHKVAAQPSTAEDLDDAQFGNWTPSENEGAEDVSQPPPAAPRRPLRFSIDAAAQLQARLMGGRLSERLQRTDERNSGEDAEGATMIT